MAKAIKQGSAPVSKYAAKKAMLAKGIIPNADKKVSETATNEIPPSNEVKRFTNADGNTVITESDAEGTYSKHIVVKDGPRFKANIAVTDNVDKFEDLAKAMQGSKDTPETGDMVVPISTTKQVLDANIKSAMIIANTSTYGVSALPTPIKSKVEHVEINGDVIVQELDVNNNISVTKLTADEVVDGANQGMVSPNAVLESKRNAELTPKEKMQASIKRAANEPMADDIFAPESVVDVKHSVTKVNLTPSQQVIHKKIREEAIKGTHVAQEELSKLREALDTTVKPKVSNLDKLQAKVSKRTTNTVEHVNLNVTTPATVNPNSKDKNKKGLPETSTAYPKHVVELSLLMKNNAEIRRFTALGIVNYLQQKGIIGSKVSPSVIFKWNVFTVKVGGFTRNYKYSEAFFINCLLAAFVSFSNSAQKTINRFTMIESNKSMKDTINMKEITRIKDAIEPSTEGGN